MLRYENVIRKEYSQKFYAHINENNNSYETLEEHSKKTLNYFNLLIDKLELKNIILSLLGCLVGIKKRDKFYEILMEIVYFHDIGKLNPSFQKEKMKNPIKDLNISFQDTTHSEYGKFIFDSVCLNYLNLEKFNENDLKLIFLLSSCIARHHSFLENIDYLIKKEETIKKYNESRKLYVALIKKTKKGFSKEHLRSLYKFSDYIEKLDVEQKEALFYLYKLIFSLLSLSDYYATMEFETGIQIEPYFLSNSLKKKMNDEFFKNRNYNRELLDKDYVEKLKQKPLKEMTDINDLRTRILLESEENLKKIIKRNPNRKVFYLNVPTGGGKTNISLKLILTLLQLKKEIKRVFYVFPYINIIEQNYEVIKETLNIEKEISPIYSRKAWDIKTKNEEEEYEYLLNTKFFNYPFIVCSNVSFFNTFIKNGKKSNMRLINIANSVVVIDEIQSLNDHEWTLFADFIRFSSKFLNFHYIIMSATLPRIDKIALGLERDENFIDFLLKEDFSRELYEHTLFKKRVNFIYKDDVKSIEDVLSIIKEILKKRYSKILIVVNTIGDSLELYDLCHKNSLIKKEYKIFLLNSTILSWKRKEIIKKFKEVKKCILISTQSIEAGADIDADIGVRDLAIFDSIEQVAGRVNRNSKKKEAYLYVINLNKGKKIYKNSYRWKILEEEYLYNNKINSFLKNRNFFFDENSYYNKVIDYINKLNEKSKNPLIKVSLEDVQNLRKLNFQNLNKVNVIEDKNQISILVNIEIPFELFSKKEKEILEKLKLKKAKIKGEEILEIFEEIKKNKSIPFLKKKVEIRKFLSIINYFLINISYFGNKVFIEELLEMNRAIPFLPNIKGVYDINRGFIKGELENII